MRKKAKALPRIPYQIMNAVSPRRGSVQTAEEAVLLLRLSSA